jgi:hypothetical protein
LLRLALEKIMKLTDVCPCCDCDVDDTGHEPNCIVGQALDETSTERARSALCDARHAVDMWHRFCLGPRPSALADVEKAYNGPELTEAMNDLAGALTEIGVLPY